MAIRNHRAFSEGDLVPLTKLRQNLVPLTKLALSSCKYTFSSLLQRQDGRGWENETLQWCPVILQELCYCYHRNSRTWWFWFFLIFFFQWKSQDVVAGLPLPVVTSRGFVLLHVLELHCGVQLVHEHSELGTACGSKCWYPHAEAFVVSLGPQ